MILGAVKRMNGNDFNQWVHICKCFLFPLGRKNTFGGNKIYQVPNEYLELSKTEGAVARQGGAENENPRPAPFIKMTHSHLCSPSLFIAAYLCLSSNFLHVLVHSVIKVLLHTLHPLGVRMHGGVPRARKPERRPRVGPRLWPQHHTTVP